MSNEETCLLEVRLFRVRTGTRAEFERLSCEGTVPLMRQCGIEVISHGPALNDETGYFLLRVFASEQQRREQAATLYGTAEWQERFEGPAMDMIDDYRIAVLPATRGMVEELARIPALDGALSPV
jgi:hypothetical protein